MTTYGEHEIKIDLETANYNKHYNKGRSFLELINNSKEISGNPNASKIKISYLPDKNLLTCIDDGISMRHKLTKCFDIRRKHENTIYHNWGEGINDSIGSLINDTDQKSMVYIFTWKDCAVDIGCIFSSKLMVAKSYAKLYHIDNIYLKRPIEESIEDIENFDNFLGNKMTCKNNPFAAYVDLASIIKQAKKYCKLNNSDTGTPSGTAIEIYYPDISINDNNIILCEPGGKTLSQFLTDSYLPQSDDQNICKFSDIWGDKWKDAKFEIYINNKLNPVRQFKPSGIGESPSEIFTLYKPGTLEELGKLQLVQSIRMSSDRNGWLHKFKRDKEPEQEGKYIFCFNDIAVCDYRGDTRSVTSRDTGYPKCYFRQKYDEQNSRRAISIYKNITKSISNIDPTLDDKGDLTHPITDQIITYDTILTQCEKALEMAEITNPETKKPTLEAPIEKFLMRFSLLPYNAYILPKDPKTKFGRMKDHYQPSDDLLHAAKFAIGMWAYDCELARFNDTTLNTQTNSHPNESHNIARETRQPTPNLNIVQESPINSISRHRSTQAPNSAILQAPIRNINPEQTSAARQFTRPRTRRRELDNDIPITAVDTLLNLSPPLPENQSNKKRKVLETNWNNKKLKILEHINLAIKVNLPDINKQHETIKRRALEHLQEKLKQIYNHYLEENSWSNLENFNKKILKD